MITINNQGPFNTGRDPDVIVGDPRAVDPGEISWWRVFVLTTLTYVTVGMLLYLYYLQESLAITST